MIKLLHGDCQDLSMDISSASIDMVLCDLPYGITRNKWDSEIPLKWLWSWYKRILKPNGVAVLTASQPFTSKLVMSNIEMFKHEWVWIKNRGSNFANTVREPFKEHESVLVFGNNKWTYNKQMQERTGAGSNRVKYEFNHKSQTENYQSFEGRYNEKAELLRVPSSWQKFNTDTSGLHPTIKPVALMGYFIKTYTNEGDVVLDNCMGSGTTGMACKELNRSFIGIENNEHYFLTACNRLNYTQF